MAKRKGRFGLKLISFGIVLLALWTVYWIVMGFHYGPFGGGGNPATQGSFSIVPLALFIFGGIGVASLVLGIIIELIRAHYWATETHDCEEEEEDW